jgi:hypothetical protein
MDNNDILMELDALIITLDSLIDIMFESTKEVIDLGNINYYLKNIILKLDELIDGIEDSNKKNMFETAKNNITYAKLDIIEDENIFNKINKLKEAKNILIDIKLQNI